MTEQQEPPFSVQIELVEGCNLRCSFCGLNGIRGKENNFKFMERGALARIVEQIVEAGWNPRLEFAMHGEPTMHPEYVQMIGIARKYAPKLHIMMTSNGGGLLRKPGPEVIIESLFKRGLNVLALDNYESVSIVPKILDQLPIKRAGGENWLFYGDDDDSGWSVQVYDYPKHPAGNPHYRRKPYQRHLCIIKDISKAVQGTHARLANHAGAADKLDFSMAGKRCAKPFREMSIRWDGNVALCCDDWRGMFKAGNVLDDGVAAVWNNKAMQAARRKLYHGMRDFGPCKGCNARSYRVGFLPDKKGLLTLPEPAASDLFAIGKALKGEPYTEPVLRPWERRK